MRIFRTIQVVSLFLVMACNFIIILGCSDGSESLPNPISPSEDYACRGIMVFPHGTQTIFGSDPPAADVDLASVVHGAQSNGTPGALVEIADHNWVVAVGIEDPGGMATSYPVLRLLASDGNTMSPKFYVPILNPDGRECRFPRVDCTYMGDDYVDVIIVYRYATSTYNWDDIEDYWDIRVHRMIFRWYEGEWINDVATVPIQQPVASENPSRGQTHPDIVFDQESGDIYCAWTDMTRNGSDLLYARYYYDEITYEWHWSDAYSLESEQREHDPWYVSLDVGLVEWQDDALDEGRYVGFAYTGNFPESETDVLWGFRPVVGCWDITSGADDDDHPAQIVLVNWDDFEPEEDGPKYSAGLARVDIGPDDADPHGAAVVFVQDTEYPSFGSYEAYGISSLDFSDFSWLSYPFSENFTEGTLPSLVIHHDYGHEASVTFFGLDDGDWSVWATNWYIDDVNDLEPPTSVDSLALGEFELDAGDFLFHDWGTASSLAIVGTYNEYWAAWSDKDVYSEPVLVYGSMGWADIQ